MPPGESLQKQSVRLQWQNSVSGLTTSQRPARFSTLITSYLLSSPSAPPSLLLFSSHPLLWFHCIFIFFIIRSDLFYSLYADCISCLAQFSQCLTVSHYKKSEICLFTCEIHCLKCVDSHLKIASNMWNCDFHTLAIFKGEPKIINMWILLFFFLHITHVNKNCNMGIENKVPCVLHVIGWFSHPD